MEHPSRNSDRKCQMTVWPSSKDAGERAAVRVEVHVRGYIGLWGLDRAVDRPACAIRAATNVIWDPGNILYSEFVWRIFVGPRNSF